MKAFPIFQRATLKNTERPGYEANHSFAPCQGCHLEGNVRLVNGNNKFEGLVEICIQGEWRNVNGYKWDIKEATVVCRQLGFSGDLNR